MVINILLIKNKNFGMGKIHPVAWYRNVDKGKAFYTSLGHQGKIFKDENFITLIENSIKWGLE